MLYKLTICSLLLILTNISYSVVRVGTTGDYPPFSQYNNSSKSFKGKDINLIKSFAKVSGEKVSFVKTTWQTASTDLKYNKFDVFVGGMTINNERKKSFLFSLPLIKSSKAAMTLCKKIKNYTDFSDIDRDSTLIIENRGGTNEKFALANIKKAKLLIINDNIKAIASLQGGIIGIHPDVMITDSVEIDYHHSLDPRLCKIPLTIDKNVSYKAFMFNKNKSGQLLVNKFDNWLKDNPAILNEYQHI